MKPIILVADDESQVRTILIRALGGQAYDLESAQDGAEALDKVNERVPDIVLLDVNMPKLTGWEVLRELKRNFRTRMIPVILLTGKAAPEDKVEGLDLGADDYIIKPFDLAELKARVAGALRRKRDDLAANPLTRLPGSPMIEDEVRRRFSAGRPFAFLYIDIDHFKAFNDAYGFAEGDQVLCGTADLLLETLRAEDPASFLGHIGGDDFIVVTDLERAPGLARSAARAFDLRAPEYFRAEDRKRGFLRARDRAGRLRRYPPLTLSIGGALGGGAGAKDYPALVAAASAQKARCKALRPRRGSRFLLEPRGTPGPSRGLDKSAPPC